MARATPSPHIMLFRKLLKNKNKADGIKPSAFLLIKPRIIADTGHFY